MKSQTNMYEMHQVQSKVGPIIIEIKPDKTRLSNNKITIAGMGRTS